MRNAPKNRAGNGRTATIAPYKATKRPERSAETDVAPAVGLPESKQKRQALESIKNKNNSAKNTQPKKSKSQKAQKSQKPKTPRKPRSKYGDQYAVVVVASPETKKILEAGVVKGKLSKLLKSDHMDFDGHNVSPGGAPISGQTKTPRKRRLTRQGELLVEEKFPDGPSKARRSLLFAEYPDARGQKGETLKVEGEHDTQNLTRKSFGPFTISRAALEIAKKRKEAKAQDTVMGFTAAQGAEGFFAEDCGQEFHLHHILAWILLAGASNPQVKENLFVGTDKSNWSKKHYEAALRKFMQENKEIISKELSGHANLIPDSIVALSEVLNYSLNHEDGRSFQGKFEFDTLRVVTENSLMSKIWFGMVSALSKSSPQEEEEESKGSTLSLGF